MSIFASRWLIIAESLIVLLQSILALSLGTLVLLFAPFEWPLVLVSLFGVWGLAALWAYFFSIKHNNLPPLWATVGLGGGLLAALGLFFVLDTSNWHVQLVQLLLPLITVHWYCLKKLGIQVDLVRSV